MGEREYNMILEHGADGKMRGRTESERGTSRLVNLAYDAATGALIWRALKSRVKEFFDFLPAFRLHHGLRF